MILLNNNLNTCWSKAILGEIAVLMRNNYSRDITPFAETFLAQSLDKRLEATSIDSAAAYVLHLAKDRVEAETFIHSLNIGYSEFFRDPLVFALLAQMILPGLIEEKRKSGRPEIRIWSAGCAAGQEPLSVAILLDQLAADRELPVSFRIIATDVSDTALATARRGQYAASEVKNVPLRYIESCFHRQGGAYQVVERVRTMVDFSTYDLLDACSICPPASIFGDFDLILCCNLLFYYQPAVRRALLAKIDRCLAPKGYLVTGETERAIVEEIGNFRAAAPPAVVFRKKSFR